MSRISKSVAVLVSALACAVLGYAPSALAAPQIVPQSLTQQGRLLDSDGAPVDGVQLTFTFSLYTAPSAGSAIWTETQSITPDNGYFSAKIGESTAFTADIFNGSQGALYLGIKIGSDAEMAPRQELTSVPFALLALNAVSATHAATADLATKATTATTADSATSADTVKSIAGNFTLVKSDAAGTANSVVLSCPAGTVIVGGFCTAFTGYVQSTGFNTGDTIQNKKYTCGCTGVANCTVFADVTCAK